MQRADDRPEAISKRLEEYHAKTAPLIDYYRRKNVLKSVEGVGELEAILERITKAVA